MKVHFTSGSAALLALLCLPVPFSALALSTDKDQPINIEADSLEINDKQGITVYKGNVVITQGTVRLDAHTVTVHSPDQGARKMVAQGNPARFKQRPDDKDVDTRAEAGRIEYFSEEDKLILLENAHIWQGGDEFSSNRIEFNTKNDTVNAGKEAAGGGRVQVIMQPKKKEPAASDTPASEPSQP
jgi:lipopolysaccharide export system protein LptA